MHHWLRRMDALCAPVTHVLIQSVRGRLHFSQGEMLLPGGDFILWYRQHPQTQKQRIKFIENYWLYWGLRTVGLRFKILSKSNVFVLILSNLYERIAMPVNQWVCLLLHFYKHCKHFVSSGVSGLRVISSLWHWPKEKKRQTTYFDYSISKQMNVRFRSKWYKAADKHYPTSCLDATSEKWVAEVQKASGQQMQ